MWPFSKVNVMTHLHTQLDFLASHHDGTVGSISIKGCTKCLKSNSKFKSTAQITNIFSHVSKIVQLDLLANCWICWIGFHLDFRLMGAQKYWNQTQNSKFTLCHDKPPHTTRFLVNFNSKLELKLKLKTLDCGATAAVPEFFWLKRKGLFEI